MDNGPSRLYSSLLTALLTIVVHIFYSLIRIFAARSGQQKYDSCSSYVNKKKTNTTQ